MAIINNFIKPLFFSRRFYWTMVGIIILFVLSYSLPVLFPISQLVLLVFALLVLLDYVILFSGAGLNMRRILPDTFSNGDENNVEIVIKNRYPFKVRINVIDELPEQFQKRNFLQPATIGGVAELKVLYYLRPVERGEYHFHDINAFVRSPVGFVVRRIRTETQQMVKVLPSYLSLRQFELLAHSNNLAEAGTRKIRKIGASLEFEQIKEYVTGDDIRSINWKATARKGGQLMVNNYTDERSQQVYCVIDKGRVMKMPFEEMTLLDYAINATLILSRVALIKQDKAGLITFSDQLGGVLPADRKSDQMSNILEMLYREQTQFLE